MSAGRHSRVAAFALVALFVLGQGALFAHQMLVPHQACAEHAGELIHVAQSQPAPVSDVPVWLTGQPPSTPHGHDHCLAFTSRRQDAAVAPQKLAAATTVEHAPILVPRSREPEVSRARLLLFAPKSSPPV
jgi:hypothetical protein